MISNTKDIWRLQSKWSDHDRFWTDHDRKLAEVSYDFFLNFTCAHKHSRQRSYEKFRKTKGIYGKTRKPLRRGEFLTKAWSLSGNKPNHPLKKDSPTPFGQKLPPFRLGNNF